MSYAPQDSLEDIDTFVRRRPGPVIAVMLTSLAGATASVFVLAIGSRPPPKKVPALVGLSLDKACRTTSQQKLQLVIAGQTEDPLIPAGRVAAQEPLAGRPIRQRRVVTVKLSTGKQPTGKRKVDQSAAYPPPPRARASAVIHDGVPAPTSAGDGDRGDRSETSRHGPRRGSPASAATTWVVVPRVRGIRLRFARVRLKQAGLVLGTRRYRSDEDLMEGTVLGQKPRAGQRVPRGSRVSLVVNKFE